MPSSGETRQIMVGLGNSKKQVVTATEEEPGKGWGQTVQSLDDMRRSWLYPLQLCSPLSNVCREEQLNLIALNGWRGSWSQAHRETETAATHVDVSWCVQCPTSLSTCWKLQCALIYRWTHWPLSVMRPSWIRELTFGSASDPPRWRGDRSPGISGTVPWETALWPHVTGVLSAYYCLNAYFLVGLTVVTVEQSWDSLGFYLLLPNRR